MVLGNWLRKTVPAAQSPLVGGCSRKGASRPGKANMKSGKSAGVDVAVGAGVAVWVGGRVWVGVGVTVGDGSGVKVAGKTRFTFISVGGIWATLAKVGKGEWLPAGTQPTTPKKQKNHNINCFTAPKYNSATPNSSTRQKFRDSPNLQNVCNHSPFATVTQLSKVGIFARSPTLPNQEMDEKAVLIIGGVC